MRKFESYVQWIKHEVLRNAIEYQSQGKERQAKYEIPRKMVTKEGEIYRCCIYKERAIIEERIALLEDNIDEHEDVIHYIQDACDECSAEHYTVTESCRGCLAHRCVQSCKREAIQIVDGRARIDQSSCVRCGRCKDVCPFNAIVDRVKPCMAVCGANAIEIVEGGLIRIDREKCISCGSCLYACPFGAISDRSQILSIVEQLEKAKKGEVNVYAVMAPAVVTQYETKIEHLVGAIRQLGFKDVIEAALGGDIVACLETKEFVERVVEAEEPCLLTSCCPGFVAYVKKQYPELTKHISTMVSPMIATSRLIKQMDPGAEVVFIGPCVAKKGERKEFEDGIDYVMTVEELEALIDAYEINPERCTPMVINNASYYGRIFARSGGVTDAVTAIAEEKGLTNQQYRPFVGNGIKEVAKALRLLKMGKNTFNFLEGMACIDGCIGGAACFTHDNRTKKKVEDYAKLAHENRSEDAIRIIDYEELDLHRKHGDIK